MVSSPEAAVSALSASVSSGRIASAADGASVTGASFKRSSAVFPAFSAVSAFSGWSALSEFPVSSVLSEAAGTSGFSAAGSWDGVSAGVSVGVSAGAASSGFWVSPAFSAGAWVSEEPFSWDSPADGVSAVSDEA